MELQMFLFLTIGECCKFYESAVMPILDSLVNYFSMIFRISFALPLFMHGYFFSVDDIGEE